MIFESFTGPSNASRAHSAAQSRARNLFPERIEPSDGTARYVYHGTPGYTLLTDLASYADFLHASLAVKGTQSNLDRLYALTGGRILEIDADGALVTDFGAVPGALNQGKIVSNGVEILATANGTGLYLLDSGGSLSGPIANAVGGLLVSMDGYFIAAIQGASACQFTISALLDGSTWDPLDFSSADRIPGQIVDMVRVGDILWFFKTNSIEGFANTGNADFPIEAIQAALIEVGVLIGSVARVGEKNVLFCSNSERGGLDIRRLVGYGTERVSTHTVETWLKSVTHATGALAFGYTDEGHDFYQITLLDSNGDAVDKAFVYDLKENQWHERSMYSTADREFTGRMEYNYAFAFGKHLVGAYGVRGIFEMSLDVYTDAVAVKVDAGVGNPLGRIRRERWAPYLSSELKTIKFPGLALEMDAGQGNSDDPNPQIALSWSNDKGETFTPESHRNIGVDGDFQQMIRWLRLGKTKGVRLVKVSTEARCKIAMTNAILEPPPEVCAF